MKMAKNGVLLSQNTIRSECLTAFTSALMKAVQRSCHHQRGANLQPSSVREIAFLYINFGNEMSEYKNNQK